MIYCVSAEFFEKFCHFQNKNFPYIDRMKKYSKLHKRAENGKI